MRVVENGLGELDREGDSAILVRYTRREGSKDPAES